MLKLSWDLFVVVIFTVIITYSFIIGKENTLKIIIGSYIAILTADGIGNLFKQYILTSRQAAAFLKVIGMENQIETMVLIKVAVFIGAILIIALRGTFEVKAAKHGSVINLIVTLIFGTLSAGLVISTLLIYVSGASFVEGTVTILNNSLASAYKDSDMVKLMIDNYNLWFALPAVSFLIASLFYKKEQMA